MPFYTNFVLHFVLHFYENVRYEVQKCEKMKKYKQRAFVEISTKTKKPAEISGYKSGAR